MIKFYDAWLLKAQGDLKTAEIAVRRTQMASCRCKHGCKTARKPVR